MKKIKNKFIIFILILVLLVIVVQIFFISSNKIDTNSYVVLVEWQAIKNKKFLKQDIKQMVLAWDSIRTIWKNSIAVIEWWDGSITRLWPNTFLTVNQNDVSEDLTKIQILFKLLSWKTWSNVINFIWEDSYFKEQFDYVEAWVRWTVFNVDLDNDYLWVTSHEVDLTTKDWKTFKIGENEVISLSNFSLVDLQFFLTELKDEAWENLNTKLDIDLINHLKSKIWGDLGKNNPLLFVLEIFIPKYRVLYELDNGKNLEKIKKIISWLSDKDKEFLYKKITTKYQKLNFALPSEDKLYKEKILYKKVLLLLASPGNKENLVKYSLFDFKHIVNSWDTKNLEETISLLSDNKDVLDNLKIDFKDFINLDLIPEDLRNKLQDNLDELKYIFGNPLSDLDLPNFSESIKEAEGKIGETLEGLFKD